MGLRILVADDHCIVRDGLRALLEREGLEVVAECGDGLEALRLTQTCGPDVAVLDVEMPGLNGLDTARQVAVVSPRTRCILLTMHTEEHQVLMALRAKVRGYVVKTQAASELVQAIRDVADGRLYLSPRASTVVVEAYLSGGSLPTDPLAPRERQVLQLVAEGKTTKEIGTLLGITSKTAESYRFRIMEKLQIHETAGLVRYAIRQGVIRP
jgi:DNA-binding NarL/FixJ family response regulator